MGKSLGGVRRRHTGGFTFVEILAALIFLAVVIPAIVSALSLSGRASELTERGAAAGQLAENKLNEMLTADAWQTAGNSASGDCGPDWPGYRWEMTQTPWTGGGNVGGSSTGASNPPAATSGTTSTSGTTTASATSGTGNIGNATVTEVKVEVFFKVRGVERNVELSTLVNSLATSTSTGTNTSTGGSTP